MLPILELPDGVSGQLFLHSMPGRFEGSIQFFLDEARRLEFSGVVCLTTMDEVMLKSPEYGACIEQKRVGCPVDFFPIPDFGIPQNRESFARLIEAMKSQLESGERLLLHCAGGHGRTGLVACCLLVAMGLPLDEARRRITAGGCGEDTAEQKRFVDNFCT